MFSRNLDVDQMNAGEMARLLRDPSIKASRLPSRDDFTVGPNVADPKAAQVRLRGAEFFRDCLAAPELQLCIGAQVMLLRNVDAEAGLVNGSRGVVVAMTPKSSGLSHGTDAASISANALIRAWPGEELPVVRFANGQTLVVCPARFSAVVHGAGEVERLQVPLKLAWAITVHKSQGMTLDRVRVSLRSMFAVGQAYVALSRARSLVGLEILDWEDGCIRTDPAVTAFYAAMAAASAAEEGDDPVWARWVAAKKAAAAAKNTHV